MLIGVILLLASAFVYFGATVPAANATVSSSGTMAYSVTSIGGPVHVAVSWVVISGRPDVQVGYCDPSPPPPAVGCLDPTPLYATYTYGSPINGTIPSGSQLFVTVLGPPGSSARVTITVGVPTLGLVLFGSGIGLIVVGAVLSAHQRKSNPWTAKISKRSGPETD